MERSGHGRLCEGVRAVAWTWLRKLSLGRTPFGCHIGFGIGMMCDQCKVTVGRVRRNRSLVGGRACAGSSIPRRHSLCHSFLFTKRNRFMRRELGCALTPDVGRGLSSGDAQRVLALPVLFDSVCAPDAMPKHAVCTA